MTFDQWPEYQRAPELGALVADYPELHGPFRRIVRRLDVITVEAIRHMVTHAQWELLELDNVGERSLRRLQALLELTPVPATSSQILDQPDVGEPGLQVDLENGTFHGTLIRYSDMEGATELFATREQIEGADLDRFHAAQVELDTGQPCAVGILTPVRGAHIVMEAQGDVDTLHGPEQVVTDAWVAGRLGVVRVERHADGITMSGQFDRGTDLGRVLLSLPACAWWSHLPETILKTNPHGSLSSWERASAEHPVTLGAVVLVPRRTDPRKTAEGAASVT